MKKNFKNYLERKKQAEDIELLLAWCAYHSVPYAQAVVEIADSMIEEATEPEVIQFLTEVKMDNRRFLMESGVPAIHPSAAKMFGPDVPQDQPAASGEKKPGFWANLWSGIKGAPGKAHAGVQKKLDASIAKNSKNLGDKFADFGSNTGTVGAGILKGIKNFWNKLMGKEPEDGQPNAAGETATDVAANPATDPKAAAKAAADIEKINNAGKEGYDAEGNPIPGHWQG